MIYHHVLGLLTKDILHSHIKKIRKDRTYAYEAIGKNDIEA